MNFDIYRIREDFPILHKEVYNKPLAYFDNAATAHKPQQVIDAINRFYRNENSNVHRGVHHLSQKATEMYEDSRIRAQKFINAASSNEVIFTKGTTDAINLVAHSFGKKYIKKDDEIIISEMEHHSNIVPWQLVCEDRGAKLKVIPMNKKGELEIDTLDDLISDKTKIIAVTHVSNALGTINPVEEIIEKAHKHNIPVLLDGAQAAVHYKVDVQALDCDFYCFSGHKTYGPTGIGVLYGKEKWLEEMPPYQGGGEMIQKVTFEKTTFNDLPYKFEAGTPNIAAAIGLKVAIEYLEKVGFNNIMKYEDKLLHYATEKLNQFNNITIYGNAEDKASVISFLMGDIHPFDMGTLLDKLGIAVRTGHHCTEPIMNKYNISGTVRISFGFYNTIEEIDRLIEGLKKVKAMFK